MLMKTIKGYILGQVRGDRASINVNTQDEIQVYLEVLSDTPKSYVNDSYLCTFRHALEGIGFEDMSHLSDAERIQHAYDYLEGTVLLFEATKNGPYYNVNALDMRPRKQEMAPHYVPIPIYQEEVHGTLAEFAQNLMKNRHVGQNDYVSTDRMDYPHHLLFKRADHTYFALGLIEAQDHTYGGFRYRLQDSELRITQVSDDLLAEMFLYEGVAFESAHVASIIDDILATEEPLDERGLLRLMQLPERVVEPLAAPIIEYNTSEQDFMTHFIAETARQQLQYNTQDLYHFHTAMKAGGLVILGGMSGTGKSRLVTTYAQALGLSEQQFSFIPVSPAWLDDHDLIGYADLANNCYMPAANNFLDVLKHAEEHPDETHIVCFDEMNLAKIEHYFAQFLAVLELGEEDPNRAIQLYNTAFEESFTNNAQYPAKIQLRRNIIFVGTVNFDESTHQLSNKVLDRATLIQLALTDFMAMDFGEATLSTAPAQAFSLTDWIAVHEQQALEPGELSLLWNVQQEMQKEADSLGFGPRTVKQINHYMLQYNAVIAQQLSRADALDEQFVSRIIPKLRGDEALLLPLVGEYEVQTATLKESRFTDILDVYGYLSPFTKTRAAILEKAKELARYGYSI